MFRWMTRQPQDRGTARQRGAPVPGTLLTEALLRRLEKRSLAIHGILGGGLVGEHRGRRLTSSIEFADYRPYTPGDDFRRIDWNAYARLDNLLIKIPEAREDVTLHLLLDVSRSMSCGQPSKLDYARQLSAGLGYMGLCRLDAVRVGALAGSVAARSPGFRGKAQAARLFRFLHQLPSAGETDLNAALATYTPQRARMDVAVLLSDLLSPTGYETGLVRLLQAGLRVVVLHVLSPEELEPDYAGDLELLDVETGGMVDVSLGIDSLVRYRRELESWQESIRAACRSRGVTYVQVRTDQRIEETLLGDFRRVGLLK